MFPLQFPLNHLHVIFGFSMKYINHPAIGVPPRLWKAPDHLRPVEKKQISSSPELTIFTSRDALRHGLHQY
jgi:hypothetical protein